MKHICALVILLTILTAGAGTSERIVTAQGQGPKVGTEVERLLKAMQGTWTITDKLAPDAKNPKGVTGSGTIVWKAGPGGYTAVEEFRSKQGEQDVTGLGILWWDEAANGFHTIWCDSTNPGGCIDFKNAARWDGPNLVLQEDYESGGKKLTFKEVFGDFTQNSFKQTLYGAEAGKELKVDETIEAKRE
jgi:hypothetical protein